MQIYLKGMDVIIFKILERTTEMSQMFQAIFVNVIFFVKFFFLFGYQLPNSSTNTNPNWTFVCVDSSLNIQNNYLILDELK